MEIIVENEVKVNINNLFLIILFIKGFKLISSLLEDELLIFCINHKLLLKMV